MCSVSKTRVTLLLLKSSGFMGVGLLDVSNMVNMEIG